MLGSKSEGAIEVPATRSGHEDNESRKSSGEDLSGRFIGFGAGSPGNARKTRRILARNRRRRLKRVVAVQGYIVCD